MRLLTKMSATGLGWQKADITKILNADNAPTRFYIAHGIKEYIDKNSDEVRYGLKGQFGGISSKKHDAQAPIEDATSKVCYLPDVAQQDVIDKLTELGPDGKPKVKGSVEFAFDIYAVAKESAATGYVFDVDMLITVEENDPLAAMMLKIGKDVPQGLALPAPSQVAQDAGKGNVIEADDLVTGEGGTPAGKGSGAKK